VRCAGRELARLNSLPVEGFGWVQRTGEVTKDLYGEYSTYQEWMNRLGELTEGDARIEELSGLEGWFTLPEHAGLAKPPKYKMALATFLGVFPVAIGKVILQFSETADLYGDVSRVCDHRHQRDDQTQKEPCGR